MAISQAEPVRTPLQRHIYSVKRRLYWSGATFLGACIITFPYADRMIAWLKKPYPQDLIFYAPTEAIFASIKIALLGGLVLAMPVILGVLLGALLGTRILVRAKVRFLRIVFSLVIVALAIQMIYSGLTGKL